MNAAVSKPISLTSAEAPSSHEGRTRSLGVPGVGLAATWMILRVTFAVVPIVAGLDKFTNLLANWEAYLNPVILSLLPVSGRVFMEAVGVIEIAAGILVLLRPRLGALVVTAWLTCIALSLLAGGRYLDVAVRDLVTAIGALTLANLTSIVQRDRAGAPSH